MSVYPPDVRFMTFNVLFGGEDRFPQILKLIGDVQPDALVLQECLGWEDGDRLARVAQVMGIPADGTHAVLGHARPRGSGKQYHVALLYRGGLHDVRVHANPCFLGHCLVDATASDTGVRMFAAHFDSHHENLRFVEARYLRSLIEASAFRDAKCVLAGDLNSLSRRDPYSPDLDHKVRLAGTDKFGQPPRFEVIRDLEEFGWTDTLYVQRDGSLLPPEWITARRDRGGVHIDYRTDYIFVSPPLVERVTGTRIAPAGGASDHDAVVTEIDLT